MTTLLDALRIAENALNFVVCYPAKNHDEAALHAIHAIMDARQQYCPIRDALAHVESLRDAATHPKRREELHRLAGTLRKLAATL